MEAAVVALPFTGPCPLCTRPASFAPFRPGFSGGQRLYRCEHCTTYVIEDTPRVRLLKAEQGFRDKLSAQAREPGAGQMLFVRGPTRDELRIDSSTWPVAARLT